MFFSAAAITDNALLTPCKDQADSFTLATKLPCVVVSLSASRAPQRQLVLQVLRPRDGIYSCDAYDSPSKLNADGKRPHQILMDLGKSMERLLTLDEKTFTRLLLHRKVIDETVDPWAESAYNYMVTKDGAILRSQLDCAIKVCTMAVPTCCCCIYVSCISA